MDGPEFPYSVGPEDKPINFHMNASDQMGIYKDNEKHQKAPPILPYHLQQMNQLLGDTFTNLVEVRNMLAAAKSMKILPVVLLIILTIKLIKLTN